jgi:sec-independent protein translocase protein TatA
MGSFSIWHWLVVGIIILLLFGKGRFSDMMGDVAKGIKSFKKGMTEDEENAATQRRIEGDRTVEHPPARPADPAPAERGPSADADRH